jgi:hypothetical protein
MSDEAGDETIADVLSRVGALNKPEMTDEVEAYGLQVHSSWTKDEIMENFEQFLIEGAEGSDVEEPEPDVVNVTEMNVEELNVGKSSTEPAAAEVPPTPPPSNTAYAETPPTPKAPTEFPPGAADVRIMRSPGWGKTGGAYAP